MKKITDLRQKKGKRKHSELPSSQKTPEGSSSSGNELEDGEDAEHGSITWTVSSSAPLKKSKKIPLSNIKEKLYK